VGRGSATAWSVPLQSASSLLGPSRPEAPTLLVTFPSFCGTRLRRRNEDPGSGWAALRGDSEHPERMRPHRRNEFMVKRYTDQESRAPVVFTRRPHEARCATEERAEPARACDESTLQICNSATWQTPSCQGLDRDFHNLSTSGTLQLLLIPSE